MKIPLDEEASLIVGGATFDGNGRRSCMGQFKSMSSLQVPRALELAFPSEVLADAQDGEGVGPYCSHTYHRTERRR
jgi:hypothetical protein